MAVQSRVSLVNHFASTTTFFGGTAQTGWPMTNVKYPQQPFVPWKTTGTAAESVIVDFGAAKTCAILLAVDVNYTTMSMGLDDTGAFSPPDYASPTLTIGRNPWNRRHTLVHVIAPPVTQRYLLYSIPSQATTDGLSYFRTGGLWLGAFTDLPTDLRWDERPQIIEPSIDVPLIGGGTSRVSTGRPYVELRAQRLAFTEIDHPGTSDDLGTWLEIDRLMAAAGHVAWYFNRGNTAEGFIVRKMNASNWNVNQIVSEDEFVLHEVVGP